MRRLKNLSEIDINTIEGRLLIAALSQFTDDMHPDDKLHKIQDVAERIYADNPLPEEGITERPSFEQALATVINKYSKENGSDTPDFILGEFLSKVLLFYGVAVKDRDKWFGVDMWNKKTDAP